MARPKTGKRVAAGRKSRATAATARTAAKSKPAARARRSTPKKAKAGGSQPIGATTQTFALVSRLVARALSARLGPKGIGFGQFPVLLCLWDEDGVTQKVLSQRVRIQAPTMVRTLDRMEREGLVKRVRSKTDRRQIHIRLTAKGRKLENSLVPLAAEVESAALAGISKRDRSQLDGLLARLIANLEKDSAGAG
ncbi:MAG: MarR family transcriptional regulator [Alphaproteobacteria bacterium]|mgnify:CR=1 FL=1|nr:MarR family transcriptional regulator [Alphaproteobacteria bacterium]